MTFGTSGFLYQNNKLMYDRKTDTLWHSLTGEPVVGELAFSAMKLTSHPVTVTTWEQWEEQHLDSTVVSIDTGYTRQYLAPSEKGSAYYQYRNSPKAMFPTFAVDDRLPEKDNVVGISSGTGESMAFTVDTVVAERVINTTLGDVEAVLVGHQQSGVIGVYERDGNVFETAGPDSDPREILDEAGTTWTATADALVAGDGRLLPVFPVGSRSGLLGLSSSPAPRFTRAGEGNAADKPPPARPPQFCG